MTLSASDPHRHEVKCGLPGSTCPDRAPVTLQQMIDLREIENVPPPVRLPKSEAFARGECGQLAGRLNRDTCDCGHLVGAHRSAGPDGPLCQFCEQETKITEAPPHEFPRADVPANDPVSWARTLRAVADKLTEAGQSNALAMTGALTTGLVARGAYQAASDVERLEKGQPEAVVMRARGIFRTTNYTYEKAMAIAVEENLTRAADRLQEDLQPAYRRAAATTFRALVESHRATAEATADQVSDLVEELETAVPVDALREEARRQLLEAQGRDKLMAYGNRAETTWRRSYPVLAAFADRGEE